MNEWILRGDANFLRYGGHLVRQDEYDPNTYEVIEVATDWDTDTLEEGEVYAWKATVSIDDGWINWDDVLSAAGLENTPEEYRDDATLVDAAATYYGLSQWGYMEPLGDEEKITTEELADLLRENGAEEFC